MHALPHSMPPTLQQPTADPRLRQTLLDTHNKSGSVSSGVTAPFCWILVDTRFSLCPPRVFPQSCVLGLYGGDNGDLLLEGLCHTQVCCTQSPWPWDRPLLTLTPLQETLKHSKAGLAQSLWDLLMHTRFCLSPLRISGGYGVWF